MVGSSSLGPEMAIDISMFPTSLSILQLLWGGIMVLIFGELGWIYIA